MNEYFVLIIGAFLGAAFSILGGFINTKHTSEETRKLQEHIKHVEVENATKRLITKLKSSSKIIDPLITAKDNMPPELKGMVPIIEHTIEPIDWIQDLSVVSNELDHDSFENLLSYFTNLKRCDDVINRVWELRASGVDFQVQLHSYWIILDSGKSNDAELEILNKLLTSIQKKNEKLNSQF